MTKRDQKLYAAILATGRVEQLRDERKPWLATWQRVGGGVWAYLRPGLMCVRSATHTVHEDTLEEVLRCVKDAVPCGCGCRAEAPDR